MRRLVVRGMGIAIACLRRVRAMPTTQRVALCAAFVLVTVVRAVLFALPSHVSLRLVRRLGGPARLQSRRSGPVAAELAWAVEVASRFVPRATCLTQAVAAQLLLRHHGFESKLCLGVAKSANGEFTAHAWIEREGCVMIGGAESAAFAKFPPFSHPARREMSAESR
ncbi:MAG TPA: lasso peptide biosynthesis B2 protein, partial [Gemmatimonadaceae bacterium]|nr:lasso peptide biosynthesis B2 protein [Gemmatimonadaceae bacterium]